MVIILDNVSIHTNDDVTRLIEDAGHLVRYLPPYSPDYNPIELKFGVLKSYIKRNFVWTRQNYDSFGEFLSEAIRHSRVKFKCSKCGKNCLSLLRVSLIYLYEL